MKRNVDVSLGWVALLGLSGPLAAGCGPAGSSPETEIQAGADTVETYITHKDGIPGRYIVALNERAVHDKSEETSVQAEAVASISTQLATDYAAEVHDAYAESLSGFSAEISASDARALADDPRVAYVEQDQRLHAQETQTPASSGLDRIDQVDLPLDDAYEFNADGEGVTIFVLDTGIRKTHEDFGGRVESGFTSVDDGNGTDDCNGHGTHVAGIAASDTFGVAKKASLVPVRVLGCDGAGVVSDVIAGIDFVIDNASGDAVANLSIGGEASEALDSAVEEAIDAGISFAAAAGNEGSDACDVSPARVESALTVGASDVDDTRPSFSNVGGCVDLFAPGVQIESLAHDSDTSTQFLSGTSMASPHVAGAAALLLSELPGASPSEVADAILGDATEGRLSGIGADSPNRLLLTRGIGAGGGDGGGDGDDGDDEGGEGTHRYGSADGILDRGEFDDFQPVPVLSGTKIEVEIFGTGDADLYVRFDSSPTLSDFDCAPHRSDSFESCDLTVPEDASEAFITVHGFDSAVYTLSAKWVEP